MELKLEPHDANCQDINSMAEPIRLSPHVTYAEYIASLLGFLIRPVVYPHYICPAQPGCAALLSSPHTHKQIKDNSLANFEAFSSSLVQPKSENPIEQGQNQVDNEGRSSEGLLLPVTSAEGFLADANVKQLNVKGQDFSLAGSGEDGGNRSMSIIHEASRSKMVHQNQVDNFQTEDRNHLLMFKSEWLRYLDPIGFNIPALKAVDIVNRGKSSSLDQTLIKNINKTLIKNINKTSLSQTALCVLQTRQGKCLRKPCTDRVLKIIHSLETETKIQEAQSDNSRNYSQEELTLKSLRNTVIISLLGLRINSQ